MNTACYTVLDIENINDNLTKIVVNSKKDCFYNYIDSYNELLKTKQMSLNDSEKNLIGKILCWDIETIEIKPRSKPLLQPIAFIPEDTNIPDLLNSIFSDDEVSALNGISNHLSPDHYALHARINDLLWCISIKNRKIVIDPIKTAEKTVISYMLQASKKQDCHQSVKLILRAVYICAFLNTAFQKKDFFDELKSTVIEKIEDKTISAGQRYYLLISLNWIDSSKADYILNKINEIILDDEITPDLTIKYYDLSLNIVKDKDQKISITISKIQFRIKISDQYANKGHYPWAFDQLVFATQETNKLNIEQSLKGDLMVEINKTKQQYNKLPENMTFQRFSMQVPSLPTDLSNGLFTNIEYYISNIFYHYENIRLSDYLNMPGGLIQTVNVVHANQDGNLSFDKKPNHIRYNDNEINHILTLHKPAACLFGSMISYRSYHQFDFQWESMFSRLKEKLKAKNHSLIAPHILDLTFDAMKLVFQGKIEIAMHIIIPQLESHLRFILNKNSVQVSNMTKENNVEKITLNQMINNEGISEYLLTTYGHDIYCNLYFLLLDKRFGNYRNNVCHGLSTIGELKSGEAYYVWWLCAYIILRDFDNFTPKLTSQPSN